MPTEFHLFSALPTKLRQQIWSLAIRPKEPGVHIFRVYGTSWDHQSPKAVHFSYSKDRFRELDCDELGLAVPLAQEAPANKPSAKSVSTYMIDAGLWTACHESMTMIRKAFPRPRSIECSKVRVPEPVRGYCISGSASLYFTINPAHDLLILRPDSTDLNLEGIGQDLSYRLSHIGIEYESDWGQQRFDERYDKGECPAFHQILTLFESCTWQGIYLVDYNLKRKANAPPYDGLCFYARDRRLIQVDMRGEDILNKWEYIEPARCIEKSSFAFALWLDAHYDRVRQNKSEALPTSVHLLGWDTY
ncbi:hypothetical protein FPRO05_00230 [Fusarium proliferatum]|uniref:2EXR domain-containing protein n=1 Tax=Gibberella intermedia TaxID=948311 RepID=A0A365NM86_GIBIN|nr:hypothetical protein FPRO05_00230 [Fusarium proliferatum]